MTIRRTGWAALAAATAGAAAAQMPLPGERVPEDARADFRLCRAAIFYHLADPAAEDGMVPKAYAQTLLDQVNLIMFETLRTAPAASLDDAKRTVDFAESFFLDFSRTIAETRERLMDRAARERLLIDCQPFLWRVLSERIDYLMLWREQAVGAPPPPDLPEVGEGLGPQRP